MSITATPIVIQDTASGAFVAAELRDGVDEAQIDNWHQLWRPAMDAMIVCLAKAGVPTRDLPQSARWNWARKFDSVRGMLSHRSLCIVHEGVAQALMRLDLTTGRCLHPDQSGLNAIYIDYLEVAPWNLSLPPCQKKRYNLCGSILVNAAVQISLEEEFMGRIALHSLPQSLGFYQRIGMTDLGADPQQHGLHRLEFTATQATTFLSERSQP